MDPSMRFETSICDLQTKRFTYCSVVIAPERQRSSTLFHPGSTAFESVAGPFENVKSYYDNIGKALGPLGLKLDYEQIKIKRPTIAEMMQNNTIE